MNADHSLVPSSQLGKANKHMRKSLIDRIVNGPKLKYSDLKAGDQLMGFEGWECIPASAVRTVFEDEDGDLYLRCKQGKHYLDGQIQGGGYLLGMIKL